MKKNLLLTLVVLLGLFLITGCSIGTDEIEEQEKEDSKLETKLEIEQISDKEFTITVQNGKKGTTKKGSIVLEAGEEIVCTYSFHGPKTANTYIVPKGKTKDDLLMEESIMGEGNSTAYDIEAGEYDVIFEVESDILTGTFNVKVTDVDEEEE